MPGTGPETGPNWTFRNERGLEALLMLLDEYMELYSMEKPVWPEEHFEKEPVVRRAREAIELLNEQRGNPIDEAPVLAQLKEDQLKTWDPESYRRLEEERNPPPPPPPKPQVPSAFDQEFP